MQRTGRSCPGQDVTSHDCGKWWLFTVSENAVRPSTKHPLIIVSALKAVSLKLYPRFFQSNVWLEYTITSSRSDLHVKRLTVARGILRCFTLHQTKAHPLQHGKAQAGPCHSFHANSSFSLTNILYISTRCGHSTFYVAMLKPAGRTKLTASCLRRSLPKTCMRLHDMQVSLMHAKHWGDLSNVHTWGDEAK